MITPTSHPWTPEEDLAEHLEERGISRRDFMGFCAKMATVLGLAPVAHSTVANALASQRRPSVVWLQLQECTGCVESVLRTESPTIGDLVLEILSIDYQHTLMAAAGEASEAALHQAMEENHGEYLLVVTGSIPLAENGIYTTIGGRTAKTILEEAAEGAKAILAVGACAHWGSVQAAKPNPTRAVGVADLIQDKPVVNIAGCPPIADVITATVVHYLTFNRVPDLDRDGRPMFAYGARIHDQCPRRANYDAGQYVETFDDEAARHAWLARGARDARGPRRPRGRPGTRRAGRPPPRATGRASPDGAGRWTPIRGGRERNRRQRGVLPQNLRDRGSSRPFLAADVPWREPGGPPWHRARPRYRRRS